MLINCDCSEACSEILMTLSQNPYILTLTLPGPSAGVGGSLTVTVA